MPTVITPKGAYIPLYEGSNDNLVTATEANNLYVTVGEEKHPVKAVISLRTIPRYPEMEVDVVNWLNNKLFSDVYKITHYMIAITDKGYHLYIHNPREGWSLDSSSGKGDELVILTKHRELRDLLYGLVQGLGSDDMLNLTTYFSSLHDISINSYYNLYNKTIIPAVYDKEIAKRIIQDKVRIFNLGEEVSNDNTNN